MLTYRMAPAVLTALVLAGCAGSSGPTELPVPAEPIALPYAIENPSAWDYFRYGEQVIEEDPETAADAFYWAMRRDPTWATPVFARRYAVFLQDDYLFDRYLSGHRRTLRNPMVVQLDSLFLRGLKLNPFMDMRLDSRVLRTQWRASLARSIREEYPTARVTDMDIRMAVERYIRDASDRFKAWMAHSEGRYGEAVELYGRAVDDARRKAGLNADMARALFMLGRYEEAVDRMGMALDELRERDEDELTRVYNSKAVYLHCIGLIHEARGDREAARDAYADALQEDLAYYPAHVRLAELALAAGDTLTAISEMQLAAEIAPDEAAVSLSLARLLRDTGDVEDAEGLYRRITEVEPYFALPFAELGAVLHDQGKTVEAVAAYRSFIDTAARDADGLAEARATLAELEQNLPAGTDVGADSGGGR